MAFGTDRSVLFREVSFIQGYPYRGIPPYTCIYIVSVTVELFAVHYVSFTLQHPDDVVVQETVEMLMKRFHGEMKAAPKLSLYDSDK